MTVHIIRKHTAYSTIPDDYDLLVIILLSLYSFKWFKFYLLNISFPFLVVSFLI